MKKHLFKTFLFGFFVLASPVHGATPVLGHISEDTVWAKTGSPYVVDFVAIDNFATLTIESGVVVKIKSSASFLVNGTLNALGTQGEPVYFTSLKDDEAGGDTNGDAGATSPQPGDWYQIQINPGGSANFDHAVIRYGGNDAWGLSQANIFNNGELVITDSLITKSKQFGVRSDAGLVNIAGSELSDNQYGFYLRGGSATISQSSMSDNDAYAIYATGGSGSLSLSGNNFLNNHFLSYIELNYGLNFFHESNNASGNGLSAFYLFGNIRSDQTWQADNIPYVAEFILVDAGATLTIEPGAVIKTPGLQIGGSLIVNGTPDKPVYFTSIKDDEVGGDTNGDAGATLPEPEDWNHIVIRPGGHANFTHAVIRYGGNDAWGLSQANIFNNGELVITDSLITKSKDFGIRSDSGSVSITGSEIADNEYGLYLRGGSATISQSSIHGNTAFGILNSTIYNVSSTTIDARSNWWGDPLGPRRFPDRTLGFGNGDWISPGVDFDPWLGYDPTTTPPPPEFEECCSSVLFLPGLEASRLYRVGEDQVWEPTRNQDVEELYLLPSGESANSDIYTRDIIDEAPRIINGFNVYKKFINFMDDEMVGGGIISEWKAIPYDWRLDFEKILASGKKIGETDGQDNLTYLEATTTPYIFQELKRLAENSDTGKVTIITHSNGGLLAKYLLSQLENTNHPYHELLEKIDKIIMVAAPQIGTPGAVEGLLHGDEQQFGAAVGVTDWGMIVDEERARELAENMQSAYNLLPSEKYFDLVQSPIVEFDPSTARVYDFPGIYGPTIDSIGELNNFLLGDPQAATHRSEPGANDEESPNVLKESFISRDLAVHEIIDQWTPPATIELVQIAGWGIKTVRGIEYSCKHLINCFSLSTLDRDVLKTHVGDGTVVLPSAVAMETAENVEKFYVDIFNYNRDNFRTNRNRDHASILEIDPLRGFIKNLIQDDETLTTHITTSIPENPDLIFLDYTIHSPVDIHIYDAANNQHTGLIPNPVLDSDMKAYEAQLPNSYYWEYGEVKYAGSEALENSTTTVKLIGTDFGTFTFNINETLGDEIIATTTFTDIPVALGSVLTMEIQTLTTPVSLQMDVDANGVVDAVISPGDGLTTEELIGILTGFIRTLHLPIDRETTLLKKIDKLAKTLSADYYKKQRTDAAFASLVRAIDGYVKKGLLTSAEATELKSIIGKIQGVVVE